MFTWVQRREAGGSIQERRRVPFPKVDCIEFTSRTMKYAHQSLRSSPGVLEGLNRILHAWSHNTGPQPLSGWYFGSVKGSIIPLPKLVTSQSKQLANALHVMVRMLARLLRKIIHPQTIWSVSRGKVLVMKIGTRPVWISKCVLHWLLLSALLDFLLSLLFLHWPI